MAFLSQSDDLPAVRAALLGDVVGVAEALLGAPSKAQSTRSTLRWGGKGSLALEVRGPKRGMWFDHEADEGKDLLGLIQHVRRCGFGEAVQWARDRFGIGREEPHAPERQKAQLEADAKARAARAAAADAEAAQDRLAAVAAARRLWSESGPIDGTAGELYLTAARCIPRPTVGWPKALRFHPRTCSLIVAARTAAGELQAVQRVRVTAAGTKVADGKPVKVSRGPMDGALVRLPAAPDGPGDGVLQLAEGPETGLSAWVATGRETWISLGSMVKIEPPPGRTLVACRDDDPRFSPAEKRLRDAVVRWRRAGCTTVIATPWQTRRYDKSDLNDVMRAQGVRGVARRINWAVSPRTNAAERQPIGTVRRRLDEAVAAFFDEAAAVPAASDVEETEDGSPAAEKPAPPVHAIRVDVGAGKSRAAYRYIAKRLEQMRAAGDNRSIAVAVPTHKLGDEHADTFRAIAAERGAKLTARVYRGMHAPDPDHPDFAAPGLLPDDQVRMCRNLPAVHAAQEAGQPVFASACSRKSREGAPELGVAPGERINCPFISECGTQRQRNAKADLWIIPHELIFMERPAAIGELALLVVDEASWADGLEGVHGRPTGMPLADLAQVEKTRSRGSMSKDAIDRIVFLRRRLVDALYGMTDGAVLRDALLDADLTHASAGEAYKLQWQLMVDPKLHPRMTRKERAEAVEVAAGNGQVMKVAGIWKAVAALLADDGPEASGWLTLATDNVEDGGTVRALHTKRRKPVLKGWLVPTLIIDATLNVELLRPYWPNIEVTAELLSTAPHQHVRQVIDRAYSKSMLDPVPADQASADPQLADRRERSLRKVHAILMREARRYAPDRVLVVAQKGVKEALSRFGPIPPNVELAHHNAVAGRDEWRDVRALIVVGRTMPSPGSVHRLAEALTGRAVERLEGGWYERGDAVRETSDGRGQAVEADRHPDPVAEAIRWQVVEGELVQIIGRGRGVNRTAADPIDVLLLTDVAVPVPVEETMPAVDLEPSPEDLMLAAGGIALENARHVASAFPKLWPSHAAVRQLLVRRSVTIPYIDSISLQDRHTPRSLPRVTYQVVGAGQKPASGMFDPTVLPDPTVFLTEHLGSLAWCRTDRPDPPPEAATQTEIPQVADPEVPDVRPLTPADLFPPMLPGGPTPPADLLVVRRPGERPIQIVSGDQPLPPRILPQGQVGPPDVPPWVGVRLAADGLWWPPW